MVKCSDISDREILEAIDSRYRLKTRSPDEALAHKYPVKVILAKMDKLDRRGMLEIGVSLRCAWLSDKGKQYLAELRERVYV